MLQKWLAVSSLIWVSAVSSAADITLSWQGTVTETSTLGSAYGVQVGNDASGFITYEPARFDPNNLFQALLPDGTGYLNFFSAPLPQTSSLVGGVSFPAKTLGAATLGILVGDNVVNPISNGFVPGFIGSADIVVFWGGVADPLDANALTIFALVLLDHSATAFSDESLPALSSLSLFDEAIYYVERSGSVAPDVTVSVAVPELSSLGLLMPVAAGGTVWFMARHRRSRE